MPISTLYVHKDVAASTIVAEFQSRLELPTTIVRNLDPVFAAINAAADPVLQAKQSLVLIANRGAFVRKCPGTREYTCCGYHILHIGTFCTLDCSYCILQSYFHPPILQYFVNHREMIAELKQLFNRPGITRIGTGEFTDSLIWETWTGLSQLLVPMFARQNRVVLELKTKTTTVANLAGLVHNRKTIASWSLNTEQLIGSQERSTASLAARLRAAARCEAWGYPLAFHFDPMVLYENCEADYRRVVDQLFSAVSARNIVWISLGTFRFMPSLKGIVQKRFPRSKIVYGEFIPGLDNKMRYFKPLRIQLYRRMAAWIKSYAPDVTIYYCMEDDDVWQNTLGFVPAERGGLAHMLDESAVRHCGLNAH